MTISINRRRFLEITSTVAAGIAIPIPSFAWEAAPNTPPISAADRGLLLYVDPRLGAEGESWRHSIEAAVARHSLLGALSGGRPVLAARSSSREHPNQEQLIYNHVLIIALPDDPLLVQAWQREAKIDPETRSIYAFGFGHLQGSVGYLEADRNPFLHSPAVVKSPYECEWVSVTGTDRAGLAVAVDAFLKQGLVNGLVAAPGWKRTAPTLLDRDPLSPGFILPSALPETVDSMRRIALTQVAEDEYRGALADTGVMPRSIWQAKYYAPGVWDGAGQISSFQNYVTGLHRRAYGNAVWAASFGSPSEAAAVAPQIASAAKLKSSGPARWTGDLPPYAWALPVMGDAPSTGNLELRVVGDAVLLHAVVKKLT